MTTLAAGSSVTFGLSVDQTFELTTTDGTTGTISLDGPFGSPMLWSFGPARQNNWKPVSKGLSGALTLTCTAGSVSYTVGSSVFVTVTTDAVTGIIDLVVSGSSYPIQPTMTWAQLQALAGVSAGTRVYVSDLANTEWIYNGTYWTRNSPVILGQSGIPLVMQSSCTIAANGNLTGLTAFQFAAYPQPCYMYFTGASATAAGLTTNTWYYASITSATTATIYNNTLNAANPTIPASPTAFSGLAGGSYTQTVAAGVTAVSVPVPAKLLGLNGSLRFHLLWNSYASANAKYRYAGLGSNSNLLASGSMTSAGATVMQDIITARNRNSYGAQIGFNASSGTPFNANGNTNNTALTIDTSAATNALIALQVGTATEWMILDSWCIEALPS